MKRDRTNPRRSIRAAAGASDTLRSIALKPYQESRGNSGIRAYASGPDFIVVQFKTGGTYLYTVATTGVQKIEAMKKLAAANDGLNTFISQHVRENYAAKLK